jgi:short-subunit dehydrogenase
MCKALAAQGARLALVAYPGTGLDELADAVSEGGRTACSLAADLSLAEERERVLEWAQAKLGPIDVLVNNAGLEFTSLFHDLTVDQIRSVIRVNLEAPMFLSHALLPGMLKRRSGHIVNISSLAGRSGPACQESYAATKAALVAFTLSLRASYRREGVSASVLCPGFVNAGIYSRIQSAAGRSAPALLAACEPEKVAKAVVRAIRHDQPEVLVSRYPMRPILAWNALFPGFAEWLTESLGVNEFFRSACAGGPQPPASPQIDRCERSAN